MRPYPLTDKDSIDLLMMGSVKAGFPSPAEEVREKLDLVKLLVQHSASTFFFRIDGEYTVKRVEIHEGGAFLMPCNEKTRSTSPYRSARTTTSSSGVSSLGLSRKYSQTGTK